ncbi:MAG TPA: hypothetical protein VF695_08780 [Sphingomonas sp.]
MFYIDAEALVAMAAVIGSLSSLVWSIRRSPGSADGGSDMRGRSFADHARLGDRREDRGDLTRAG